MIHFLTFGDINTRDFHVGIYGDDVFRSPARSVEKISVDGRNGDVIFDNGRFENVTVPYHCYLIKEFASNVNGFRAKLKSKIGYQRLEDSFHPDEFRMGAFIGAFEPVIYGKAKAGEFDIEFDCKPQRWLKIGEKTYIYSSDGLIINPTEFDAKPMIRVYGSGSFSINGTSCQIIRANEYTDLDFENEEAFKGNVNCNLNVNIPIFPSLKPGKNYITLSGVTRLEVIPRWYTI